MLGILTSPVRVEDAFSLAEAFHGCLKALFKLFMHAFKEGFLLFQGLLILPFNLEDLVENMVDIAKAFSAEIAVATRVPLGDEADEGLFSLHSCVIMFFRSGCLSG